MPKLHQIIQLIENFAPKSYQESYDNSGLLVGEMSSEINGALLCLDITEEIIDEAVERNCNLIISHHPLVFKAIKRFSKDTYINRCLHKAIKNDIALYCCHTNIDSVRGGVSFKIAERLNLKNPKVLSPIQNDFVKLVVFAPVENYVEVADAMCEMGGGAIGNYDNCSFACDGIGTFRGNTASNPAIGNVGEITSVNERRIEVIIPRHKVVAAMQKVRSVHPYEEVGYDVYPLINSNPDVGLGVVGTLEKPMSTTDFLSFVAQRLDCKVIRHSQIIKNEISKVALCGGSGSEFVSKAISQKADIYLTADFKYHDFFVEKNLITIADIGHFEGEKYTLGIFYDIISKKMPNFAIHCTNKEQNPINYFIAK